MRTITLLLIATILMPTAVSFASDAAQTPERMDATVMLRGEIAPEILKKGSYAHVEYKSGGIEGAAWGPIEQIKPEGIVIESAAARGETRIMAFGDIYLLAVADDRQTLERWQEARKAAANVTVKSRGELDLSELETGSYAHAVYTWRGLKRRASGKIAAIDPSGVTIKSTAEPPETWTIASAEIDTVAFSRTSQALDRWRRWTQSGILRMSRWDLNTSLLAEGLYINVDYLARGGQRTATGKLVDSYADRIEIQYRVGKKATWAHPGRLEIAYDDVETVIIARDREDLRRARIYVEFASGRDAAASGERIAAKLIFGAAFGLFTGSSAAFSHFPDVFLDDYESGHSPLKYVIPSAILHAATTSWVVSKADPASRFRHAFVGGLLGCAAVATVTRLTQPAGYDGLGVVALGYLTVPAIAATISSEHSRKPPDAPGFTVGVAPRRDGSFSALATLRF